MRNKVLALALLMLMIAASQASCSSYVEGEALAVFIVPESRDVSATDIAGSVHASIAETYETLSELEGKVFVLVRSQTKTTQELIDELKARPDVLTASPNYYSRPQSITASRLPNDPSADQCWGMNAINAPEVWEHTTGSKDVYVGIIDTGLYRHPDLEANIASELGLNVATVSGDYDSTFVSWDMDRIGHGTHVAGTIGAVGNNGVGVAGVNWNVSMFSIRVFDDEEKETISNEMRALNYIASLLQRDPDMKIAAVNMSLGSYFPKSPEEMKDDVYYMAFQALDNMDRTLIIAGAGNEGIELGKPALFDDTVNHVFKAGEYAYPASFTGLKNFIVVGATDSENKAGYFSEWGDNVDIAAPGVSILSTYATTTESPTYEEMSGTSMATPHVAGAAALLASAFPNATPSQIKAALLDGANRDKNPVVYPYAYAVKEKVEQYIERLDTYISYGFIPAESRDAEIEQYTQETEAKYSNYKQLDGTGHISRTGLLDIKAAYDLLAERDKVQESLSSSSGGCDSGKFSIVILLTVCAVVAVSRVRRI